MFCEPTLLVIYTRHEEGHDHDKVERFQITALSSAGDSGILNMPDSTIRADNQPAIDELLQRMPEEIPTMRCQ